MSFLIGGFPTARLTRTELATQMVRDCLAKRTSTSSNPPKLVFSSNGRGIALAGTSKTFMDTMSEADIIHADGMPIVLASRLTRHPLPERIATTDFFHDAAIAASVHGLRFFFLGASEEQNLRAVNNVKALYPDLMIAGRHHGYFSSQETSSVLSSIRESKADVVWVALGKPRQEQWCVEVRDSLPSVGWLKTCGGLFGFLANDSPRAPKWMQSIGVEWLFRVCHDPKRLLRRYLTTNPHALWRILRYTEWR